MSSLASFPPYRASSKDRDKVGAEAFYTKPKDAKKVDKKRKTYRQQMEETISRTTPAPAKLQCPVDFHGPHRLKVKKVPRWFVCGSNFWHHDYKHAISIIR